MSQPLDPAVYVLHFDQETRRYYCEDPAEEYLFLLDAKPAKKTDLRLLKTIHHENKPVGVYMNPITGKVFLKENGSLLTENEEFFLSADDPGYPELRERLSRLANFYFCGDEDCVGCRHSKICVSQWNTAKL